MSEEVIGRVRAVCEAAVASDGVFDENFVAVGLLVATWREALAVIEAVDGARAFIADTGACPECGSSRSPHRAEDGQDHNPSCYTALMLHHLDAWHAAVEKREGR